MSFVIYIDNSGKKYVTSKLKKIKKEIENISKDYCKYFYYRGILQKKRILKRSCINFILCRNVRVFYQSKLWRKERRLQSVKKHCLRRPKGKFF